MAVAIPPLNLSSGPALSGAPTSSGPATTGAFTVGGGGGNAAADRLALIAPAAIALGVLWLIMKRR